MASGAFSTITNLLVWFEFFEARIRFPMDLKLLVIYLGMMAFPICLIGVTVDYFLQSSGKKEQEIVKQLEVGSIQMNYGPSPYPHLALHFVQRYDAKSPARPYIVNHKKRRAFWASVWIRVLTFHNYIEEARHSSESERQRYLDQNGIESPKGYPKDFKKDLGIDLKQFAKKFGAS